MLHRLQTDKHVAIVIIIPAMIRNGNQVFTAAHTLEIDSQPFWSDKQSLISILNRVAAIY